MSNKVNPTPYIPNVQSFQRFADVQQFVQQLVNSVKGELSDHATRLNNAVMLDGTEQMTGALQLPEYTTTGLPTASAHKDGIAIVTDNATYGRTVVYSDGTNWIPVSNTSVTLPLSVANGGTGDTGSAWSTWTPTFSPSTSGSFTITTNAARFKQLGKTVWWNLDFSIASAGTAVGYILFTMPANAKSSPLSIGSAVEVNLNGFSHAVHSSTSTQALIRRYDNNTSIYAAGARITGSGVYEAA